ncbi:MAG: pyruvate kinase [Clostridia bacterium]
MRKTKIVATLGPATDNKDVLKNMIIRGLDVARINFSHGEHKDHLVRMNVLKEIREELNIPVAILLDTKGPEIRTGIFENKKATLKAKQTVTLKYSAEELSNDKVIYMTSAILYKYVSEGTMIFIDDGRLQLCVSKVEGKDIVCQVINGGDVSDRKSINVPGVHIDLDYLSERDASDIIFGIEQEVDFVAASFTRCKEDILEIRNLLDNNNGSHIEIIAKIENREGIDNIDEILKVSDGLMVARGDLGIEVEFEEIPRIQKLLIKKAYSAGKKAITATQMLESMISNPRPTRAETTDVANAVYDGTSAIMLSGETAVGKYPVEAIKTMDKIALYAEESINYKNRFYEANAKAQTVADSICHATVTTAHDLNASAIITVTKTGTTARMLSRYRPACPIFTCTTSKDTQRRLSLSWGVKPVLIDEFTNTDELFEHAVDLALEYNFVKSGDIVPITTGIPLGVPGTTNMMKVHIVGHILGQGIGITTKRVSARICSGHNEAEVRDRFKNGDIIVIPETTNEMMDILRKASGIITQEGGRSSHAAVVGFSLDIPVVCEVPFATKIFKTGTTVTIDSTTGLIYNGIVTNT